jgi:hypothetical protein
VNHSPSACPRGPRTGDSARKLRNTRGIHVPYKQSGDGNVQFAAGVGNREDLESGESEQGSTHRRRIVIWSTTIPFADGRHKGVYLVQQLLRAYALRPRRYGA